MRGGKEFVSPLELAKRLRASKCDPSEALRCARCMSKPVCVRREDVRVVRRLSRVLYHLSAGEEMLVSLALNPESAEAFMGFEKIVLHKMHDGIYYWVDVHL